MASWRKFGPMGPPPPARPRTRRISSGATRPGSGRRTTSKRRVCRRRGERHATPLSRRRPEAKRIECRSPPLDISLRNEIVPPSRPMNAPWLGWVFNGSGDLPRCWFAIAEWRGAGRFRSAPGPSERVFSRLLLDGLLASRARLRSPVTDYRSRSGQSIKCACSTSLQR